MSDPQRILQLIGAGQIADALRLAEALVSGPADEGLLSAVHSALKAGGQRQAAEAVARRWVSRYPRSAIAWHNQAAILGDLDRYEAAETAARQAIALGLQAPETWLVLARALQGLRRLDAAEEALGQTLSRRPTYADAHRDLAQLVWMRTGDADRALVRLNAALGAHPDDLALMRVKATVLEFVGDAAGAAAYVEAELARRPQSPALIRAAVYLNGAIGDSAQALWHARRGAAYAGPGRASDVMLAEALLATGQAAEAAEAAERAAARDPLDQYCIALATTAWRLMDDPRHRAVCDYAGLVRTYELPPPAGWTDALAFRTDIKAALEQAHVFIAHPFDQSVRGGAQLPLRLDDSEPPPVRALLAQLKACAEDYVRELGPGEDLFRRRISPRGLRFSGVWSVRLGSGGRHTNHVHPRGWLSSAYYVDLPPEVAKAGSEAGRLQFGEPGLPTTPKLPPEYAVTPAAGRLVLFPSYMWHGTTSFVSNHPRLSVAFDAIPA